MNHKSPSRACLIKRGRPAALLWFAAATLWAAPSAAETFALDVSAECSEVQPSKLRQALSVELAELLEGSSVELGDVRPRFALTCAPTRWSLTVLDELTSKSIARTIPAPVALKERTVALAFSELLLASWLELIVSAPEDDERSTPASLKASRQRARDVVSRKVKPALTPEAERGLATVHVGFGVVAPNADASLMGPQARLSWVGASRWGASLGFEVRQGELGAGEGRAAISQWTLQVATLLRLGCALGDTLCLDALGGLNFGVTELRGLKAPAGSVERAVSGAHSGAVLGVVPSVRWRRFALSLPTIAQATWLAPQGRTLSGAPVDLLGASLAVGLEGGVWLRFP